MIDRPVHVPACREEAAVGAAIRAAALIEGIRLDELARRLVSYEGAAAGGSDAGSV